MNADGSGQRRLTRNPWEDITPTWSPDGRKIAFSGGTGIFVMNADGSGKRLLTRNARRSRMVARRAEDRLHGRRPQRLGRLRHERRRERAAEPHAEAG